MKKKKPVYEGKLKLKKGDEIIVLSGKDKGKRGKIIQTNPEEGKVIVDGINVVTRHRKSRATGQKAAVKQQLGEMQVPLGLSVNKVMLVCPKCSKETRMARERSAEGVLVRKCRKCGQPIDG